LSKDPASGEREQTGRRDQLGAEGLGAIQTDSEIAVEFVYQSTSLIDFIESIYRIGRSNRATAGQGGSTR
jgi:hypothetical protein